MEFYYSPGSIALASAIALEEAGIAYAPVRLNFGEGQQRGADYLRINPKGRVPALVTPAGTLTETPAIMRYVAALNPGSGLWPGDPFQAARVDEVCAWLCSTVHVSHAHKLRGARWSDDPVVIDGLKAKVTANMTDHFTQLAGQIRGPFFMGDQFTAADAYIYAIARWLPGDDVDIATLPVIAAHFARVDSRPAVRRALAALQ